MATAQQLEKLHQIQRLFYVEDSLESAVAGERVTQLIARTEQLLRQRAFLRDERRRLRISSDAVSDRQRALVFMQRDDWLPSDLRSGEPSTFEDADLKKDGPGVGIGADAGDGSNSAKAALVPRNVLINIGGLMFEAPVHVLQRDEGSLLAQLCGPSPPVQPDPEGGFFYFDRDWWLFRYVMTFLRDGTLPEDRTLLSKLYREAAFWHLVELQTAIEEEKLHLRSQVGGGPAGDGQPKWWQSLPSWWQAVDAGADKSAAAAGGEGSGGAKDDWWTGTAYRGKSFLPLSSEPDKATTEPGQPDAQPLSTSTWSHPPPPSQYPYL